MDDDPANLIVKLLVLFALILVNAFFAMSEIAIITLNDMKMQKMAEDGNKKAKKILLEKFGDEIDEYLEKIKGRH